MEEQSQQTNQNVEQQPQQQPQQPQQPQAEKKDLEGEIYKKMGIGTGEDMPEKTLNVFAKILLIIFIICGVLGALGVLIGSIVSWITNGFGSFLAVLIGGAVAVCIVFFLNLVVWATIKVFSNISISLKNIDRKIKE